MEKPFINTTLILKNLPPYVSMKELRKIFTDTGPLKFINILKNDDGLCKGVAFVRYESRSGSERGLSLDGFWYKNNKIFVEYAFDKREQ